MMAADIDKFFNEPGVVRRQSGLQPREPMEDVGASDYGRVDIGPDGDSDLTGIIAPEVREEIIRRMHLERERPVLGMEYLEYLGAQGETLSGRENVERAVSVDAMRPEDRPLNRRSMAAGIAEDRTSIYYGFTAPELPQVGSDGGDEPDDLREMIFGDRLDPSVALSVEYNERPKRRLSRMLRNRFVGALALGVALSPLSYNYVKTGQPVRSPIVTTQDMTYDLATTYDYFVNQDGWKPGKLAGVFVTRLLTHDKPSEAENTEDSEYENTAQYR